MFRLLSLSLLSFLLLVQPGYSQGPAQDTIILVSNRKLIGKVKNVSSSRITYIKKGTNKVKDLSRKQIHKIKYANGRVEKFNSLAFQMLDETDYKAVVITDNPQDVEGLYEYGSVAAKSGRTSRTAKAAERNARIRLQRRAAAMGALYVLITKSETRGGYREIPTHFYEGIAYGFEPPKKKKK